jgi:general transcription factor 3C polypeptide 3 (transcription factor C subunit 4)
LRGRNKEALELCTEVIRLAPNTTDAYLTIGSIHEAMGSPRKALDFFMIAAHLPPRVMPSSLPCCWCP